MTIINVQEAKTHLSRLLDEVEAGREIVLARAGKPVARLVPLEDAARQRQPGLLAGMIVPDTLDEPLPPEELDAWEGVVSGSGGSGGRGVRSGR